MPPFGRSIRSTGVALLTALGLGPAVAAPVSHRPSAMLIDQIPTDIWPEQRAAAPEDHPTEQQSLRADVARFLEHRFHVRGDRLFIIPPDHGFVLTGAKFLLNGPGQFAEIHSEPALDRRPYVVSTPDAQTGAESGKTLLTIGVTQTDPRIYTAIALHVIPNSTDELIGYFQLDPLVPDPAKGL